MKLPASKTALLLALSILIAGCAVGPNYHKPSANVPVAFKEAAGWKEATPADASAHGDWWTVFNDPLLNELESQVAGANQSLAEAAANYEAARQVARAERGQLFPTLGVGATGQRARARAGTSSAAAASTATTTGSSSSGNGSSTTSTTLVVVPNSGATNTFSATGTAAWSPDFWGRVRRQIESDEEAAQASAAQLASARLSLQAQLANDYLELRILDARRQLLENSVASYRRTLQIAQNKYRAGVSARSDLITAQTQLDSTRAQVIDTGIQRAQLEHAIAVIIGKAPAEFSLPARSEVAVAQPAIPAAVPSQLLERRPDVAYAERSAAAANARIGVQVAAYFPDLSLTGEGGFEGSPLRSLITYPNRFWTLGASATDTLIDFGIRRALVREARAEYDASVAAYRQAVLTAIQQVEDELVALRLLTEEAAVQENAVSEATQASQIAENEYRAGTVDYTTVITAQNIELQNRETALTIQQNRLVAAVTLIQDLGGGWNVSDLPTNRQVLAAR